ncbi:MAG TPA: sugar phosphate isomerase/epimerase family protein [Bryobacteraceae bacterium]|jgi:sugar phosphate isomerase/epimerase|nr:sugar phosphate isomerase/epimerase family protein [Bryobacteraceae bacterium]
MRTVNKQELGLMFWSSEYPEQSIAFVQQFHLHAGQLGFGGDLPLDHIGERWQKALANHSDFAIPTAVCSYRGEDYGDIALVQQTVGLVPPSTRQERVMRTKQVADIAAQLGIGSIACHIGFVPADRESVDYRQIRDVVRDICDHSAPANQTFALETGQEPAHELLHFIEDVDRPNLKVNFDPANMVLYGTGDPIEALRLLGRHVVSVHCKDGDWPSPTRPGSLGEERRLGDGAVDFKQFLKALDEIGYTGILSIEREEPDPGRRLADIHHAISFLNHQLEVK